MQELQILQWDARGGLKMSPKQVRLLVFTGWAVFKLGIPAEMNDSFAEMRQFWISSDGFYRVWVDNSKEFLERVRIGFYFSGDEAWVCVGADRHRNQGYELDCEGEEA